MEKSLQEMANMDFREVEGMVNRAALEVASNALRARDNAESRKWGRRHRAELLCTFDRLNVFLLQFCDGWLRSCEIERALELALVPVDPADENVCDSCQ